MDAHDIATILKGLNSNKIKERKDGLSELTTILKNQADILNTKILQSVAESLIEALDLEQRKYSDLLISSIDEINNSTKVRLSEERLSSVAYVLRLFIEKTTSRFKQKTLHFLLAALPELMININTGELIPVIAVHLSVSINDLVSSDAFTLKFIESQWIDIIDKQTRFLERQLNHPQWNNRITTNILITLCTLLSLDTVGIIEISDLSDIIIKLLRVCTKEDANTRLILRIVNKLIIKRHCVKLKSTLLLINETIKYIIILNDSKNKDVQVEMVVFDYCSSELVGTKAPETNKNDDSHYYTSRESISTLMQEYIILKLNQYKPNLLLPTAITFKKLQMEEYNLVSNEYIQVMDTNDAFRWIELKSLVKLLISYFSVSSNEESYLFWNKRAKLVNDCSSYLRSSSDLPHFLMNCIEANNSNQIKTLGYHLLFCFLVYYDIDKVNGEALKQKLLDLLKNDQQNEWLLYCFVPLISHKSIDLEEMEIIKIFKIALPLLKSDYMCKLACVLLTHLIRYLPRISSENKIIGDIHDIYEYSEVNGPSLACAESFELWLCFQYYGSNISINTGIDIAKRVTKWLASKWCDFDTIISNDDSLSVLVAWLAGDDVNKYYQNNSDPKKANISQNYVLSSLKQWNDQKRARVFLTLTTLEICKIRKPEVVKKISKVDSNQEELEHLLHSFSSHVHSQTNIYNDDLIKSTVTLLLFFDKLYLIQSQHSFIVKSQDILEHIFHSKALMTQRAFSLILSKLKSLKLYNINFVLSTLFELDMFSQFLINETASKSYLPEKEISDADLFDTSVFGLSNIHDATLCPATVVWVLLGVLNWGEREDLFGSLLSFIQQQPQERFWECLDILMGWLNNSFRKETLLSDTFLSALTQFLGETLLGGKFNTSSESIRMLSRYLEILQQNWIQNNVKVIEGDYCDILDWILLRLMDNSFSGVYALFQTASLLLQVLEKSDAMKYDIQGGKKRIFSSFMYSLNQLPLSLKCMIIERIPSYLNSLSSKNQVILISELEKLFMLEDTYFEKSVFGVQMLKDISQGSYPLTVLLILRILEIQQPLEIQDYTISVLNCVACELKMVSRRDVFDYFKFDIIYYFCEQLKYSKLSIDRWNISLFEFDNKSNFLDKYRIEIAAILYSMDLDFDEFGKTLYNDKIKNKKALLEISYPLAIPLTLISDNRNESLRKVASLRRKYPLLERASILVIVKTLLRFMDFGNITDIRNAFATNYPHFKYFEEIFDEHHTIARYEFPLNINLVYGFQALDYYKLDEAAQYKFLIMWIINDLTQSKTHLEVIRCIREINFLILVAFNDNFQPFLKDVVTQVAPYLADLKIHSEIIPLVVLFFKNLHKFRSFPLEAIINVFLYLIVYKRKCGDLDNSTLRFLSGIDIASIPIKEIWTACIQMLKNETGSQDISSSMKALLDMTFSRKALFLFSLLLGNYTAKLPLKGSLLSQGQINKLINIKIPEEYITPKYKLWLSLSISSLTKFDIKPQGKQEIFGRRLLEVSTFPNYTNNIINAFLSYYEDKNRLNVPIEDFLCSTIVSYFITLSNKDTTIHLLSQEQIEIYSTSYCVIDENIFDFIVNHKMQEVHLDTFLSEKYFSLDLSYDEWVKSLINSFVTLLEIEYPYFKVFNALSERSTSFCEAIFIELIGLLIYSNPKNSLIWVPTMLGKLCSLKVTKDGIKKLTFLIQLLLLLRYGHINGNRQFSRLYKKLDLTTLSEVCVEIRYHNIALLLLEEVNMTHSDLVDYKSLQTVYEGLDDKNFLLGLPAAESLSETWLRVNNWKNDVAKSFLFNNAKIDSEYSTTNLDLLIESSNKNGYNSISNYLSKVSKTNGDPFGWNIKLSEWKLPIPEKIESKSTGLYTAIKKTLSDSQDVHITLSDCLENTIDNYSNFKTKDEWMSLVKELVFFRKVVTTVQSKQGLLTILRNEYDNLSEAEPFYNFGMYVVNLDGRYNFVKALLQRPEIKGFLTSTQQILYPAAVLIENIKLSISNGSSQYALRNSFVLENVIKSTDTNSDSLLALSSENHKNFIMANALWICGEKRTAVDMLRASFNKYLGNEINFPLSENKEEILLTSPDEVRAKLILWLSELRLESHSRIYEKYINKAQDVSVSTTYLNVVANYLSTQVHKIMSSGEVENLTQRNNTDSKQIANLQDIYENDKLSKSDRTDAWRKMKTMQLQIDRDNDKLKNLVKQKETYLLHSLLSFIKILYLTNEYDSDVIDKLFQLWFENDKNDALNTLLNSKMAMVPSWKFLPWINQIASKLSYDGSEFQNLLIKIMIQLVIEVPYESVYALISILFYDEPSIKNDSKLTQKVMTAKQVLSKVKKMTDREFYEKHIGFSLKFSNKAVELAMEKYNDKTKYLTLDSLNIGNFWLNELPHLKLPLPTLPSKFTGPRESKGENPYIIKVENVVDISSSGISLPKIMTFILSDGRRHKILFKGSNDDLRQDAIMEQVFHQVNNILGKDKTLVNDRLNIRTYEVVPLGPKAGLIEFVANSIPLHKILTDLHVNDSITFRQARQLMKAVQNKSIEEKLKAYLSITKQIKPQLHNFFFKSFLDPDLWYESKKRYIKSVATSSIVGHILGLGDRHLNNLLVDSSTGEVIHIDLGIAFDQGRLLSIPELVPFRLTRDIVDGFGITGVDGLFRANCEKVYSVLRTNSDKLMCVLNILKWDPLYSWVMSPLKKHRHLLEFNDTGEGFAYGQMGNSNYRTPSPAPKKKNVFNKVVSDDDENEEAQRALKTVKDKLFAHGLSVEATVQELIQQATDETNLAVIFCGWTPFY